MTLEEVVGALGSGAYLEEVGCRGQGIRLVLEVSSWIPHPIPYQRFEKSQLSTSTAMSLLPPGSSLPHPTTPTLMNLIPLGHTQTILPL